MLKRPSHKLPKLPSPRLLPLPATVSERDPVSFFRKEPMNPNQNPSRSFGTFALLTDIFMAASVFADSDGDNFNDNARDVSKWGTDKVLHHGKFNEANGRLEYTVSGGTTEDDAWRPWILSRFPYNADWEIQFDVFNSSNP